MNDRVERTEEGEIMRIDFGRCWKLPVCVGVVVACLFTFNLSVLAQGQETALTQKLTEAEKDYFISVYKDTWDYLGNFVDPWTGLPYDSSARQPATSISNVGLYMVSAVIAYRTNLISKAEAQKRIEHCLDGLEKIETWRGIPRPWFLIRSLKPTYGDEFSYGPHVANLLAGLLVSKTIFPEMAPRIDRFILNMDLRSFYDVQTCWLKGGYNVKTENFAIFQPWGHWYYKYFASEIRFLSFYLIARELVPPEHWFSLIRPVQEKEGETFFVSGYEEGGLFRQYLTSIFLDERDNEMGRSQKAYARFQMKHAKKIRAPVWGWSSSQAPNGRFLGYGELQDGIVAPYASMLASVYFPKEAYRNLRKLEARGARPTSFGFRDAINWKTKSVSKNYLTVNQAMGFLSLANLLYDGIVWKSFQENPLIGRGFEVILQSEKATARIAMEEYQLEEGAA